MHRQHSNTLRQAYSLVFFLSFRRKGPGKSIWFYNHHEGRLQRQDVRTRDGNYSSLYQGKWLRQVKLSNQCNESQGKVLPDQPKLLPSRHSNVAGDKEGPVLLLYHAHSYNLEGANYTRNMMMGVVEGLTSLPLGFRAVCFSGSFFSSSRPDRKPS